MKRFLGLVTLGFFAVGCGHVAAVRPVPKGALQPELSFGGPMAEVGGLGSVPLPLSTLGARYGIAEKFDLSAHVHLTSLAFGVAGLDVGSTYLALPEQGAIPALSVGGRLYGFTDVDFLGGPRAYVELSGSASYLVQQMVQPYLSTSVLFQFAGGLPLVSVAGGAELILGNFGLTAEARWYAPYANSRYMVVDWWSMGNLGAVGFIGGLRYRFGGEQ